jgi:hypothetical protein
MQNFNVKSPLITGFIVLSLISMLGCGMSKKNLRKLGVIVAVGIAAKLIYDMVVEHKATQVNDESDVVNKYKKTHKRLPNEPVLVAYQSDIRPGDVVKAGNQVSIISSLEVVRSESSRTVKIEEEITIYDNEDHSKPLKSLTKQVNQNTNASGAFQNEFTFKLPKGMPQGIYPVKTKVLLDGKAFEPVDAQMQLVLNETFNGGYQLVAK